MERLQGIEYSNRLVGQKALFYITRGFFANFCKLKKKLDKWKIFRFKPKKLNTGKLSTLKKEP